MEAHSISKKLSVLTFIFCVFISRECLAATQPWGTALGSFNGVVNYSDDPITMPSPQPGDYINGQYVGLKWECVEYVQRYYYMQYAMNLYSLSGGLNARDFFGHAASMQLTAYANGSTTAPQVGDILCFSQTSSGLGHVAIIRAVGSSTVTVIQQNVKNGDTGPNGADDNYTFAYNSSTYVVDVLSAGSSHLGSTYYCQGWLRKTSSGRLSAPTLNTPVNGATGVSATPSFSWSQVSGNQGFRIIVSTSANDLPTDPTQAGGTPSNGFNQTIAQNTTSYTWTGTPLSAGTTYYWEVHALGTTLDQAGYWSSENNFTTTQLTVPITFATSPAGLQVTVDGTTYTTPTTFNWTPSSQHSLSVPTPQYFGLYSRYQFTGTQSQIITTPSSSATYTTTFSTQYDLTESAATGGSVNSSGGWYNSGTLVSISATANSGYSFSSWTGSGTGSYYSGNSSSTSITMNGPIFETANFTANPVTYTITVSASPSAGGTAGGTGTFAAGTSQTVTATANSGYTFTNWTENGSVVSSSAGYNFTLNASRNLVANFKANPVYISVSVGSNPSGRSFTVDGINYTATQSFNWVSGLQPYNIHNLSTRWRIQRPICLEQLERQWHNISYRDSNYQHQLHRQFYYTILRYNGCRIWRQCHHGNQRILQQRDYRNNSSQTVQWLQLCQMARGRLFRN